LLHYVAPVFYIYRSSRIENDTFISGSKSLDKAKYGKLCLDLFFPTLSPVKLVRIYPRFGRSYCVGCTLKTYENERVLYDTDTGCSNAGCRQSKYLGHR
jgi:hypothetical protein